MWLLIDLGNTRIKWMLYDPDAYDPVDKDALNHHNEEIESLLTEDWAGLEQPTRILISSVISAEILEKLTNIINALWPDQSIERVQTEAHWGRLKNAYIEPKTLGVDRWMALIAAAHYYESSAVCVIDCGTAVTMDVVAENGEHLGGIITPGLSLMRQSLIQGTEGIDALSQGDISLLARDTSGGVYGGTMYALVAVIDRIVNDVETALDTELTCVLTGGDAEQLLPLLADHYNYEPDLVLLGLATVAEGGV